MKKTDTKPSNLEGLDSVQQDGYSLDEKIEEPLKGTAPAHENTYMLINDTTLIEKQQKILRVATYNILTSHLYRIKEGGDEKLKYLSWEFRKDLIIELITRLKPDILGLQEVSIEQYQFLRAQLTNYEIVGFAANTGNSIEEIKEDEVVGEIIPILYDRNRLRCLDAKVVWLSATPAQVSTGWDASRPRIITCAAFQDITHNKKIVVGNTHYDHKGRDALVNSGSVEAHTLEQYRLEHQATDVIYMGDRNCFTDKDNRGNEWYRLFKKESGATDTRLNGHHIGLTTTFIGYHPDAFKAIYHDDSRKFETNILDLIFHKGSELEVDNSKCTPAEYEIISGRAHLLPFFGEIKKPEDRLFSSDHCCVITDLKYKNP